MKHNFAIISCGGTISMEPNKNGVLEPKKGINQIISEINLSALSDSINIPDDKKIELFKLDSSDLNHLHWTRIINQIEDLQDKCDGILVFHGTDTMAYSATAVGLALSQKIKIPIVFTGSQSPIGETGTDGKSNIERSLLILERAVNDKLTECIVFFGDEAYRAVNCRKRSESDFKAFESPRVKPLYIIGGLGIRAIWPGRKAKDVENSKKNIGFNLKNSFANGIVVLPIIPGLEPNLLMTIAKEQTTSAIILYSLGTGNVPSLKGGFSLIPAIHKIIEDLKKPIIVASPFVGGSTNMEVYMPGVLAKEAGAINAGKMTAEATVVKVRLLLAQSEYDSSMKFLSSSLATDFAGEGATE